MGEVTADAPESMHGMICDGHMYELELTLRLRPKLRSMVPNILPELGPATEEGVRCDEVVPTIHAEVRHGIEYGLHRCEYGLHRCLRALDSALFQHRTKW